MRKIVKTTEPKSLTAYRSTIPTKELEKSNTYEDFKEKTKEGCKKREVDNIRVQLLEDQGYICCYCMDRIDCDSSKIEHFKPQTKYRKYQIDYQNLFVACLGGEGQRPQKQHCDTKKGEEELHHIKLLTAIEQKISYQKSAKTIIIQSQDKEIDKELNSVLNLNVSVLQKNRKHAYDSVIRHLKTRGYTVANIKKVIKFYQEKHEGKLEPYCEMIVYFLRKKLHAKQ